MYTIFFGALVLLLLLTYQPGINKINPNPNPNPNITQEGGYTSQSPTVCSPGSDIVIKASIEQRLPVAPYQNCLTGLRMTRADEDQLNIINHREYNNLSWVLRKPVGCPRKRINCLQETSATTLAPDNFIAHQLCDTPGPVKFPTWQDGCCDRGLMNIDPCNAPPGGLESGKNAPKFTKYEKAKLDHLSPLPMKTTLKEYYGGMYYYDFRYPREPLPIEFSKDPEGFCSRNPGSYPCYVRASRYDLK